MGDRQARARHVGLTGGIGSGKSTVARLLEARGAAIVDADAAAHRVTAAGGAAISAIAAAFGTDVLTPSGALDRARMRSLVFSDPAARARLEAIIHPVVAHEMAQAARAYEQAGVTCIVFDIPLLVESPRWRPLLEQVVVVDCQITTQVRRVCARSQLTAEEVERIIATQASRARRLAAADIVVFNDTDDFDALRATIDALAPYIGL